MSRTAVKRSKENKATVYERKLDRIALLYCHGKTQTEIGADPEVKMNRSNVSRALVKVRERWKERASRSFEEKLNEELAKLDRLENEAWAGYQRSLRDAKRTMIEDNDGKTKKSIVTEANDGDPRFLVIVESIADKRLKLLGAYAPTKIAPTTPDGKEAFNPFAALPMEQLLDMAKGNQGGEG